MWNTANGPIYTHSTIHSVKILKMQHKYNNNLAFNGPYTKG